MTVKPINELRFRDDARIWLSAILADQKIPYGDQPAGAIEMAGAQPELVKPGLVYIGETSGAADTVAYIRRGSVLIVLADADRVLTISMAAPPRGRTRQDVFDAAVRLAKSQGPGPWHPADAVALLPQLLETYGGPPSEGNSRRIDPLTLTQIIGWLLAPTADGEPRDLARRLTLAAQWRWLGSCYRGLLGAETGVIQEHVCPAMVGLVGPGVDEGHCGAWPMLVLLGRYAEVAMDAADG
jgi:hypothetical protein